MKPAEIRRFAENTSDLLPARPMPPPVSAVEPKQEGEKRALLETDSQPFLLMGYKRPNQTHPDDPVFDVIAGILSSGRTGLLYKDLVRDKRIALGVQAARRSHPANTAICSCFSICLSRGIRSRKTRKPSLTFWTAEE